MTPEDKKFERIAQRHIADLKKSSKAIVEDAAVLAAHKVMAEFAQGAHTEAKVEYHTTMIQCPHCDGSVRVQAQPYPDNFIHALMYDVAKRDSEAQQPVVEHPPCQGMNCGITRTDQEHSLECQAEHAAAIAGGQFVKTAQQQEPVATVTSESGNPNVSMSWWHEPALPVGTPLYTSPPASKPWVALTSEDKVEILRARGEASVLHLTEAKLREKNA